MATRVRSSRRTWLITIVVALAAVGLGTDFGGAMFARIGDFIAQFFREMTTPLP